MPMSDGEGEHLPQGSPVGTVIKGALHPLGGSCVEGVGREGHEEAGQGTAPLTSHGIAFVWHGT